MRAFPHFFHFVFHREPSGARTLRDHDLDVAIYYTPFVSLLHRKLGTSKIGGILSE